MLHCVPRGQGSRSGPSMFFFLFFYVSYFTETWVAHHQFIVLLPIKGAWRNNFSGPSTIILKALFLCMNGARNPLLIHGFWPVNARLLIEYGTAFYAIICICNCVKCIVCIYDHVHVLCYIVTCLQGP